MTQIEPASQAPAETASASVAAITSPFADWPGSAPWQPLPDAAQRSFMLGGLLSGAVVALAFASPSLLIFFEEGDFTARMLAWTLSSSLLIFALFFWRARLAFANARWMLDDDGLRVRRGRYWRREILIPRARVQHLDVERGPIERRYGLATLIVHTAGTRMQALRQPGFDEATAARLRDAMVPQHRETDAVGNTGDSRDDNADDGVEHDSASDAAKIESQRVPSDVDSALATTMTVEERAIPMTTTDGTSPQQPIASVVRMDPT